MNYVTKSLIISVVSICSCNQQKNTPIEEIQYTPEQFVTNTRISGGEFSKDGSKIVYSSDEKGNTGVWVYDLKKDSTYCAIYNDDYSNYSLLFAADGKEHVYASDKGGGFNQAKIYITNGEQEIDLTPGEGIQTLYRGLKNDYSGFYYSSNILSPKSSDLYEYNFETKTSKMRWKQEGNYSQGAISGDQEYLILYESITEEITDLHLLHIKSGNLTRVSPENNIDSFWGVGFSKDNKLLYYVSNFEEETKYLSSYKIQDQTHQIIYKNEKWDVMSAEFSTDQKLLAINTNQNGSPITEIIDVATNKKLPLTFLDENQVVKTIFSPNNNHVLIRVSNPTSQQELWLVDLNTGDPKQIAENLNTDIEEKQLSIPEEISYKSFDGLEIPALLFKPPYNTPYKLPALIWTHGGPGGQFFQTYNEQIQYIVNQGYIVLAVNNRRSSGYGKTFKSLDNQKHGVDDLKDIIHGKSYLKSLKGVDGDKIGIIGDSYGGYLVLAALTFYPDEFEVGIDMCGISNWLHILNSMPDFWAQRKKALFAEIGNPIEDSIMLKAKSPLFHSEQISKPLMVIQGANDSKVPKEESDLIVAKVRENGIEVEYILFDDEGHGIRKQDNRIEVLTKISDFLNKHLIQKK